MKTIFISGLLFVTVGVTNLFFTGFETTIAEVALGAFTPDMMGDDQGAGGHWSMSRHQHLCFNVTTGKVEKML